jgi:ribonuclease Z
VFLTPGHAVGYHFFNEEGTRDTVYEGVREIYDGPLSLATDNMVWNITRDGVKTRMAVSPGEAWSVPGPNRPPKPPAAGTMPDPMSDAVKAGRWDVSDAQGPMIKEFKKAHGMK